MTKGKKVEPVPKQVELTQEQHKGLVNFINKKIPEIVSDDGTSGFRNLEPLLNLAEVETPQGFEATLQKLRETRKLVSKLALYEFLPFGLHGDFDKMEFEIHSRGHDYFFVIGAERQPSGFTTFVDAYLEEETFVPYAHNVLGALSCRWYSAKNKMYFYSRFLKEENGIELKPEDILGGVKLYDKVAHSLVLEKPT